MAFLTTTGAELRRPAASILDLFMRGLRRFQEARMAGLLHRMSDDKLAEIGVARSEIDAYARRLVEGA